ncbi:urease accessory protein UreD [Paenibacillus sp. NEAU-GSW1]|nr:urease accessory protein UreD [Paenibacillus sp. NEAU-GSW1]
MLRAAFRRSGSVTVLANKYHTAPIKIAKAFPLEEGLGVIVMDVSPGLLNGDRYELDWHAHKEANIWITNQSYTKVHPSRDDGGSSMLQCFSLEENAVVEHMPEPLMLYQTSRFYNETRVQLSPGAVWMQADILCPGRTLRQEVFKYRELHASLTVHYGDELIFAQRQRIVPGQQRLASPGCWEEQTHWATFYVFSDRVSSSLLEPIQQLLEELPAFDKHRVLAGATLTFRHGLAVSAASTAAWPLQQTMKLVWETVRFAMLGKKPVPLLQK